MIFQEQALERFMLCPLMTPTSPSQVETCAYALASWALRKSFEGKFSGPEATLHLIRGEIIKLYSKYNPKAREIEVGQLSRTAGYRLLNLMLDYEVIHLEEPYNLILASYTIQGKYALLRKRKGAKLPYIFVLHSSAPVEKHEHAVPPSLVAMARYLHSTTHTKYTNANVLHYPMFRGKHWVDKGFKSSLAKSYLQDILKIASLRPQFPIAGKHCELCSTKPCMEVFNGQDDNNR